VKANIAKGQHALVLEEQQARARVEAELQQMRTDLEASRLAIQKGSSEEAERQRQLTQQMEREREKRVEHLQHIGARRISQMGLSRGWQAWYDQYEAIVRQQQMLRQAGARLMRPKLAASFGVWRHEHSEARRSALQVSQEQTVAGQEAKYSKLEYECVRLKRELTAAKAQTEAAHGQVEERQRALAERLDAERDKRIVHLQQVAARRISQMGLARGWHGWVDTHVEHKRRTQLLVAAGSRLIRPKLAASMFAWRASYQLSLSQQQEASYADKLVQERLRCEELQNEVWEVRLLTEQKIALERVSAAEERRLLVEKDRLLAVARKALADEKERTAAARKSEEEAKTMLAEARKHGRADESKFGTSQNKAIQKQLEYLQEEQRKVFNAELKQLKSDYELKLSELRIVIEQLEAKLRDQRGRRRRKRPTRRPTRTAGRRARSSVQWTSTRTRTSRWCSSSARRWARMRCESSTSFASGTRMGMVWSRRRNSARRCPSSASMCPSPRSTRSLTHSIQT